jgi:hypothetical protein
MGWTAKLAAISNASSTVAARVRPAWWHMPSNTLSSLASAPVCEAAARCPPAVTPPFKTTSGFRIAACRAWSKKRLPSSIPST